MSGLLSFFNQKNVSVSYFHKILLKEISPYFFKLINKLFQHAFTLIDMSLQFFDQFLGIGLVSFVEFLQLTSNQIELQASRGVFVLLL
jgi:hypothetical protein